MFVQNHVRATVVLTMLAVMVAGFSLMLPWYQVTEGWVDDREYVHYDTVEFSRSYFVDDELGTSGYDPVYIEVGSLLDLTTLIVVLWGLLAIVYVGIILPGADGSPTSRSDGFVLGWILVAVSLLVIIVFAGLVVHSYNLDQSNWWNNANSISSFAGSDGLSEWGPLSGWFVAVAACVIQGVAVLVRNVPVLLGKQEDAEELTDEQAMHGDLPLR